MKGRAKGLKGPEKATRKDILRAVIVKDRKVKEGVIRPEMLKSTKGIKSSEMFKPISGGTGRNSGKPTGPRSRKVG